ncbi:hypothetical protein KJ695_04000, partial [Patescibacteria group bacterium]|nr:hypothetical protein [Patescibacteria group bacterium]
MSKKLRMKCKRAIAGIVMITTIVWLSGVMALVPVVSAATIVDGDVVRNPSAAGMAQFDVYIAKLVGTKKFKRLVLNPQVFASYGHLEWENVKLVTTAEMDSLTTSGLVRVDGDAAQKVYALAPSGDTGAKSWVNVTATQFVTEAAADPDSIYTINSVDVGNYTAVADVTTVAQVTTFLTAGTLPSVTPVVTGTFTAALASDNPAAGTLASGSAYNTMLKVLFTNGTNVDVNVTGITVTRTGFSVDTNVAGVLVKDSVGARHGNVLTLSEAKAALSFASDPIKVGAGKTETVSIQVNLGSTATSGTIGFKINAVADITASTAATGTFPLVSSTFSLVDGSNTLGGVSVQSQTISTSVRAVDIGVTGQEIGKFKFSETSSREAVNIKKVRFYNNGNTTDADLANIELYNTNIGTSLAKVDSTTNKYVTFDLSASPLKFDKGTNKTLSVRADVVNGSTRTAQFIIQNDYDIEATGVDTASGVLATVVAYSDDGDVTTFPVGSTTNFNTISITAGSLTVSKDSSSPSGDIGQ